MALGMHQPMFTEPGEQVSSGQVGKAELVDDATPVERTDHERIPWVGTVRGVEVRRGQPEVKPSGGHDLEPVGVHPHMNPSGGCIVAVGERIGQRLPDDHLGNLEPDLGLVCSQRTIMGGDEP